MRTASGADLHVGEGQQVLSGCQPVPPELLVEQRTARQEHERHAVDAQQVVALKAVLAAADGRYSAQPKVL